MIDYPAWWDSVVTIYQRRVDGDTEETTYRPVVLSGCFWKDANEELKTSDGSIQVISSVLRIPAAALADSALKPDDTVVRGDMTSYWPSGEPIRQRDMKAILDMFKQYGAILGTIYSIADNRRAGIGYPHVLVRCKK